MTKKEWLQRWKTRVLSVSSTSAYQMLSIDDNCSEWTSRTVVGAFHTVFGLWSVQTCIQGFLLTHKYVDDTTLSEIVAKSATFHMQIYCDVVVQQSEQARVNINGRKTKEMPIGSISKDPLPHLMLCGATVDRVTTFKLLGVHVSSSLKWTDQIDAMVSNAASCLHFLKQLNRAGAPIRDLLHFYTAIVQPVLEYACPVWHSGLTAGQSKAVENIQKRAIRIIYGEGDYKTALIVTGVDSLKNRRKILMVRFFNRQVLANNALLHQLLPERPDSETIRSLRNFQPFHSIRTRTNRFLPYYLDNFT